MMEENVSQRINRLREQEELGVYELARMVNVSARTVYEWEKGRRHCRRSCLNPISSCFRRNEILFENGSS